MFFIRSCFPILFSLACVFALLSSLTFFIPVINSSPVDVEIEPKYDGAIFQEGSDLSAYLKKEWNDYQLTLSNENYTFSSFSPFLDTPRRSISKKAIPEKEGDVRSFYAITEPLGQLRSQPLERVLETAKLVKVSENLYIYIREDYADSFSSEELTYLSDQFENAIFPIATSIFGDTDGTLGDVDNDPHITVYLSNFPRGGYYDSRNEFTSRSESNAREMVYVDVFSRTGATDLSDKFSRLLAIFAHEFFHLIQFNHDQDEHRWVDEGLAELTVDLVGYKRFGSSADLYLLDSDSGNSLFLWDYYDEAGQNRADYSASHLFFRYLTDRYGTDFLSVLVSNSRLGAKGVQSSLNAEGHNSVEFFSLFHDWVMSLHLNDKMTPYSLSTTNTRLASRSLSFSSDGKLEIQGDVVLSGIDAYKVSNFKSDTLLSINNTGDTLLSLRTYSYKKEFNSSESPLTYQTIGVQPGDTLTHYIPHSGTTTLYFHISGMSDSLFPVPNHHYSIGVGTPNNYSLNFQQAQLDYIFGINDSLTIDEEQWMLEADKIKISSTSTNDVIGDVTLHIVDNRFNVDKIVQLVYSSDSMDWGTGGAISVQSLDPGNYTLEIVASEGSKYGSQQFSTQLAVTHKVLGASLAIPEESFIYSVNYYRFFVSVNYTQTGDSTYLYNGVDAYFNLTPSGTENSTYLNLVTYSLDNQNFTGYLPKSIVSSPVDLHFYLLFDSDELVHYQLLTNYSIDSNVSSVDSNTLGSTLSSHTSSFVVPFLVIFLGTSFVVVSLLAIFLGTSILYIRKRKNKKL